jgi:hypothetical protein
MALTLLKVCLNFGEMVFDKGAFALENLPRVEKNVKLIKGWFDKTLPTFIQKEKRDIAYLHVDCDLYSSTKTIFEALGNQIVTVQ